MELSKLGLTFVVNHMSNVLSGDQTRIHLNGVRIKKLTDTTWGIESTNGHMMCRNEIDATECDSSGEFFMPGAYLADLKLELNKLKSFPETHRVDISRFCSESRNYPDTEMFYKPDSNYTHSISFNAEYLFEMLKAMRDHKKQTTVVLKFAPHANPKTLNPLKVTCNGTSHGVLMPCRE